MGKKMDARQYIKIRGANDLYFCFCIFTAEKFPINEDI
mgnify:CR=1 FL=1